MEAALAELTLRSVYITGCKGGVTPACLGGCDPPRHLAPLVLVERLRGSGTIPPTRSWNIGHVTVWWFTALDTQPLTVAFPSRSQAVWLRVGRLVDTTTACSPRTH